MYMYISSCDKDHAIIHCSSPINMIYQYQSWAIRNCSVMLFSTLLQRTLGVKKTKDEHSVINLLTATEFFTRYPQLKPYLIEQLTEAVRQLVESGEVSTNDCNDDSRNK
jgi:hypothetical protein